MEQTYCKGSFVLYKLLENTEIGKVIAYDCGEYVIENCENGRKSNISPNDILEQV